jgi:hypothetical protein
MPPTPDLDQFTSTATAMAETVLGADDETREVADTALHAPAEQAHAA